jgi:hypothetical protein
LREQLSQLGVQDALAHPCFFDVPEEGVLVDWSAVDLEHHDSDLVENVEFVSVVAVDEQFEILTLFRDLNSFQLFD